MNRPRHLWTDAQIATLHAQYPTTPTRVLAERMGLNETQINHKAYALGLKKLGAYLQAQAIGRLRRGDDRGAATRFKPGQVPWNKGRSGLDMGESATRFQAGQKPHSFAPIGSERWSGGYLQRKLTDTGYPPRDWVCVHRIVWEATHGPIPAGHVVVFRDRDPRHLTLDNLELVSRRALLLRNSVHNLPEQIIEVLQIKRSITRHINRMKEKRNG